MKRLLFVLGFAFACLILGIGLSLAQTVAFLPMDGTEGSTTFTDTMGNTWTASGNVHISTAQAVSNGASAYFDGNNDYIGVANSSVFDFSGPFTIDFYMFPLDGSARNQYIAGESRPDNGWGVDIRFDEGYMDGWGYDGWYGQLTEDRTKPGLVNLNNWNHIMISANLDQVSLYINGQLAVQRHRGKISDGANPFRIGDQLNFGGLGFKGYIDDFRISDQPLAPVPIPGAAWLLGSGLLGLAAVRRKKKQGVSKSCRRSKLF